MSKRLSLLSLLALVACGRADAEECPNNRPLLAWYVDADADGHGGSTQMQGCALPADAATEFSDCDDTDSSVNPDAVELCDAVDNDCDGSVDPDSSADARTWYIDADGDGFGDPSNSSLSCHAPTGSVAEPTDCDDADADVSPAAIEVCDTIDNDCDGAVDPDTSSDAGSWYADVDGDGFGDAADEQKACSAPDGFVATAGDCDDAAPGVNPAATEVCDSVDNDCDPATSQTGMVQFTNASTGVVSDVSSSYAGSSTTPIEHTVSTAGELLFCEGTYYVDLTISADVSLFGVSGDASDVVLDGAGLNTVLYVDTDGVTLQVQDLSIENGAADTELVSSYIGAGGLNCPVISDVILDNVVVSDSTGTWGGGLSFYSCDLTATELVVQDNSATRGGGVFTLFSVVRLEESQVIRNTASSDGGGLFFYGSGNGSFPVDLVNSEVRENDSVDGGGMYAHAALVTQTGTAIDDNTALLDGGAVYLSKSDYICDGSGNPSTLHGNAAGSSGGAFSWLGSSSTVHAIWCDLGAGSQDNSPDDIEADDTSYSYGDGESFSCTGKRCD